MDSYGHVHDKLLELSWDQYGSLAMDLAKKVKDEYGPDCIVGNAKGGCIVGGTIAAILRLDFYPMRVSRRKDDEVVLAHPAVVVPPSDAVAGRRVLLVDDMAASGETFALMRKLVGEAKPKEVRTLSLARHHDSYTPDFCGIASDDCIAFPWDRWVYTGKDFVIHPELD